MNPGLPVVQPPIAATQQSMGSASSVHTVVQYLHLVQGRSYTAYPEVGEFLRRLFRRRLHRFRTMVGARRLRLYSKHCLLNLKNVYHQEWARTVKESGYFLSSCIFFLPLQRRQSTFRFSLEDQGLQ